MDSEMLISLKYVLFIQTVLMIHAASPEFSSGLWNILTKKWHSRKEKRLLKKKLKVEEKSRKYWEIEMKDLR